MGWLGSLCRSVGRAVGRGVETIGKVIGSERVENWGRSIQDACRETSVRTGKSHEYNQNTATVEETQNIAKILADFSANLKEQASGIEADARKYVDDYFSQLLLAVSDTLEDRRLARQLGVKKANVLRQIDGALHNHLSKRVSLTDHECTSILEKPKGPEKEKAMCDFGKKVIREGLNELSKSIQEATEEIRSEIDMGLEDLLEQQTNSTDSMMKQLAELLEKRQQHADAQEEAMFKPAVILSASDLTLGILDT